MADGKDDPGRSRRDLLRSLSGAGFLSSLAETVKPKRADAAPGSEPPSSRPVIPAGREREILGLLGKYVREPVELGFKLEKADVAAQRIDYHFTAAHTPHRVIVSLVALSDVEAGVVQAYTRSFRVLVGGDGTDEERFLIGERVAAEVMENDRGQLWVRADGAPRG